MTPMNRKPPGLQNATHEADSMSVQTCEVPSTSVLDRQWVESAFFRDAYRVPLSYATPTQSAPGGPDVIDVFFAVFGHHPMGMKRLLIGRNWLAAKCGLAVPLTSAILTPQREASYTVGDTIGPWPIFSLTPRELVAGRNNTHLDFRLSVLVETTTGANSHSFAVHAATQQSAVISTVCHTHNVFGKLYLLCIIPFHIWGVKLLIARAVSAGRL